MSRKHQLLSRTRRLTVDGLEPRAMLAGNVWVGVTNGVLQLQGDALSNRVEVRQLSQSFTGEWPGAKYQIRNVDGTINGQSSANTVQGVKFGTNLSLEAGDDYLRILNIKDTPGVMLSHPEHSKHIVRPARNADRYVDSDPTDHRSLFGMGTSYDERMVSPRAYP